MPRGQRWRCRPNRWQSRTAKRRRFYEHVAGDSVRMADALGDRNYTGRLSRLWRDLEARAQHGVIKYGQHLYAYNGRDMTIDAYQECAGFCVVRKRPQIGKPRTWACTITATAWLRKCRRMQPMPLRLHDMMRTACNQCALHRPPMRDTLHVQDGWSATAATA